jgi:Aldose 1-epimerase
MMEIHTTQPGIQFYDGNLLDASITGKGGKVYVKHYGFCLETQHFPDSPNRSNSPRGDAKGGEVRGDWERQLGRSSSPLHPSPHAAKEFTFGSHSSPSTRGRLGCGSPPRPPNRGAVRARPRGTARPCGSGSGSRTWAPARLGVVLAG